MENTKVIQGTETASSETLPDRQEFNLYGCGGTGLNIVSQYKGPDEEGFGIPNKIGWDSSSANLPGNDHSWVHAEDFQEGAGQDMMVSLKIATAKVKDFLAVNKPKTNNIVVFGASGGTGPSFGAVLAATLIKNGYNTVCIMVGSPDSKTHTQNIINCLRYLDHKAHEIKDSINMFYLNNTSENNEAIVDLQRRTNFGFRESGSIADTNRQAFSVINTLSMVFSGQNFGLDNNDIRNFLTVHNPGFDMQPGLNLIMENSSRRLMALVQKYKDSETTSITSVKALILYNGRQPTSPIPSLYFVEGGTPQKVVDEKEMSERSDKLSALIKSEAWWNGVILTICPQSYLDFLKENLVSMHAIHVHQEKEILNKKEDPLAGIGDGGFSF